MTKKLIKTLSIITVSILGISLFASIPVFADNSICNVANVSSEVKAAAGCPGHSTGTLDNSLTVILKNIILILGLVAVIFIVVGGVNYMTSSGDATKTKKAKDTILYAVIGLIICALAFAIVNFVIDGILSKQSNNNEDEESYTPTLVQNDIAFFKK